MEKRGYSHALRIRRGGGAGAMHALRIRKSGPSNFALRIRRAGRTSSFQHALRIKKSPSNFALRIKKDPEPPEAASAAASQPGDYYLGDEAYDESEYADPTQYYGYAKRAGPVGRRSASLHTLRIKKSAGWNGSNRGLFWLNSANLQQQQQPQQLFSSRGGDSAAALYQPYAYSPDINHINRDRKSSSFSHVLRV